MPSRPQSPSKAFDQKRKDSFRDADSDRVKEHKSGNSKPRRFGCAYLMVVLMLIQSLVTMNVWLLQLSTNIQIAANRTVLRPRVSNRTVPLQSFNMENSTLEINDVDLSNLLGDGSNRNDMSNSSELPQEVDDIATVSIHVLANARPKSLQTLLVQLRDAHYDDDYKSSVSLHLHLDGDSPDEVLLLAQAFNWTHGRKAMQVDRSEGGVRDLLASVRPQSPDEVLIIFEDDHRVSPFFFDWALHLLREYGGLGEGSRDPSLLGISLAPRLWDDISDRPVRWNASAFLRSEAHLFLHVAPAPAALVFADRWADFIAFYRARIAPPFYDMSDPRLRGLPPRDASIVGDLGLVVPTSRTRFWRVPARRFLTDFCFGRALYTLYTNAPGGAGFATSLHLGNPVTGQHAAWEVPSDTDVATPTAAMLRNRRVAPLIELADTVDALKRQQHTDWAELPVFDLWGRRAWRDKVQARADDFLRKVAARRRGRYMPLVALWAGEERVAALMRQQAAEAGTASRWEEEKFLVYQVRDNAPLCARRVSASCTRCAHAQHGEAANSSCPN